MDKIKNLCDRLEIIADHLEEQGCLRAMAGTVRETIEELKRLDTAKHWKNGKVEVKE